MSYSIEGGNVDINPEFVVLTGLLQDANRIFPMLQGMGIGENSFEGIPHKKIFEICKQLWNDNKAIDIVTIYSTLISQDNVKELSHCIRILGDLQTAFTTLNIEYFAQKMIVSECKRRGQDGVQEIAKRLQKVETLEGFSDWIKISSNFYDRAASRVSMARDPESKDEIILETVETIEKRIVGDDETHLPVPLGLRLLDENLSGGIRTSQLITLGARTGEGKTTTAVNFSLNTANFGAETLFVTYEMSAPEITEKALSALSRASWQNIQTGAMTEDEQARFEKSVWDLKNIPWHCIRPADTSLDTLLAMMEHNRLKLGIRIFFVDFVQSIRVPSYRGRDRVAEITEITRSLKNYALEKRVTVVQMSQLNRGTDETKAPNKKDLKGSGSIEEDSDIIILIWHEKKWDEKTKTLYDVGMNLSVDKYRKGKRGMVLVKHDFERNLILDHDGYMN